MTVALSAAWSLAVGYLILTSHQGRAGLLLLPLLFVLVDRYPDLAVAGSIPAAAFGLVVLPALFSFPAYVLPVAVAGLGILTGRWRLRPAYHMSLVALAALVLASAFTAPPGDPDGTLHLRAIFVVLSLAMSFAACAIAPDTARIVRTIAALGGLVGLVVIGGWFRTGVSAGEELDPSLERVSAIGLNPNALGLLLALGFAACIGAAIERRSYLWILPALPCIAALPSLKSRTPLLLVAASLMWMLIRDRTNRTRRLALIGAGVAVVLAIEPSIPSIIYRQVLGGRADVDLSGSDAVRRQVAGFALSLGIRHPVFGIGFGQFSQYSADRFVVSNVSTHNEYLRVLAELGIPGLILLATLMVIVARAVRHSSMPLTSGAVLIVYGIGMLTLEPLQSLPISMGALVLAGACVGESTATARSTSEISKRPVGAQSAHSHVRPVAEDPVSDAFDPTVPLPDGGPVVC